MVPTSEDHELRGKWIRDAFLELDLPEGLRAELIDGEIVVVPPADRPHNNVLFLIIRQILANCPDLGCWPDTGVETPRGHYIPDLISAPVEWGQEPGLWNDPSGIDLVVEVTSSRPQDDRVAKRLGYAEAGIPFYLLVDRERRECVLRAEPGNGDYHSAYRAAFGEVVPLPQPFGFALLTAGFPKD